MSKILKESVQWTVNVKDNGAQTWESYPFLTISAVYSEN